MVRFFGREWGGKVVESLKTTLVGSGKSTMGGSGKREIREYYADVESKNGYTVYKPRNIKDYYDKYFDRDLVRAPIDDLAESAFGMGCYTTIQDYVPLQGMGEDVSEYERKLTEGRTRASKKSKTLIDEFNKYNNLDEWLVNIGKNILIAGFLPVDTRLVATSDVSKNTLKIIHPTTVKEVWVDKFNEIFKLVLEDKTGKAEIEGKYVSWFSYGQVGNDPFGVSYVRGLISLLDTLDRATDNVDLILERYISPKVIYKISKGRDFEATKAAILSTPAGEDLFLGDLSQEEMEKGKLYDILQIGLRVPFWEYIVFLRERIYSYSRSNDIWFSKDTTVASAETIDKIVKRHQHALQRSVKRGVERFWYDPLVKLNNAGSETPRLNFGVEKTGVEDIHIEPLLNKGLDVRYLDQDQYYDLLMQLGLKVKPPSKKSDDIPPTPIPTQKAPPDEPPDAGTQVIKREEYKWIVQRLKSDDASHKHD